MRKKNEKKLSKIKINLFNKTKIKNIIIKKTFTRTISFFFFNNFFTFFVKLKNI